MGFKKLGENTEIRDTVKFGHPEMIEIGDNVKIDDYTLINGGKGTKIGKGSHLASFVSIIGGGELEMGDYASLACGVRLITGTSTPKGRMSTMVPKEQMDLVFGKTIIGKEAVVGTNCTVHPQVTIGEGAVIGSNSLVLKDVEPWTISVGSPCKVIKKREPFDYHD